MELTIAAVIAFVLFSLPIWLYVRSPKNSAQSATGTLSYHHDITLHLDHVRVTIRLRILTDGFVSFECSVSRGILPALRKECVYFSKPKQSFLIIPRSDTTLHPRTRRLLSGYKLVGVRTGPKEVHLTLMKAKSSAA